MSSRRADLEQSARRGARQLTPRPQGLRPPCSIRPRGKLHRARKVFPVRCRKPLEAPSMKRETQTYPAEQGTARSPPTANASHSSPREFASVEEMLRHDALHTPVPPTIRPPVGGIHRAITTTCSWTRLVAAHCSAPKPHEVDLASFLQSLTPGVRTVLGVLDRSVSGRSYRSLVGRL